MDTTPATPHHKTQATAPTSNDWLQVQTADFQAQQLLRWLQQNQSQDGAVVNFIGQVRQSNQGTRVTALELEHYPGMTEQVLQQLIKTARQRWSLGRVCIVHRVGRLKLGEQIVFVGVSSAHRQAAFEACQYLMDILKTKAPFWKKEHSEQGSKWLDARASDQQQAEKWQ